MLFCVALHFNSQLCETESFAFTRSKMVAQLCDACQQKASPECLLFSQAVEDAALRSFLEINSSCCNVVELDTDECLQFYFPILKVQKASPCKKSSYRFPNKCFLQHFAATAISKSYHGELKELESQKTFCLSRPSFYLRLERMLLPLISCFLKQHVFTLEIKRLLDSVKKYLPVDLLFWGLIAYEAGPEMPAELCSYINEHLKCKSWSWIISEKNYETYFACFSCMSTPPRNFMIDLRKCEEANVLESILALFEKVPINYANVIPVNAVLFYHSKATPLRPRFPSWIKLKKVEGTLLKDDITAVLQCPDLAEVSLKITQVDVLSAFINSVKNASEELRHVTFQLDASIADGLQQVNALPEIETLKIQVEQVTGQNFNKVVNMLLKLVPKNNSGTTIALDSSDLDAMHCRKLVEVFSVFKGGCISVYSEVSLTPQDEENINVLFHRDLDGLHRLPPFQLEWNDKQL